MTKRELSEQNKILCDDLGLLVFAAALADVRLPLEKAAAYAIRDGIHTEDEVAVILERLAARLIPPLEMMRAAQTQLLTEQDIVKAAIVGAAVQDAPRIILPT